VVALDLEQPFVSGLPEPAAERHGAACGVIIESYVGLQEDFLDHVRLIEPSGEAVAQTGSDKGAQIRPVKGKELVEGRAVAALRACKQFWDRCVLRLVHGERLRATVLQYFADDGQPIDPPGYSTAIRRRVIKSCAADGKLSLRSGSTPPGRGRSFLS
jgi:hypothetical protein